MTSSNINVVVFSKDRACQLDLLLQSMKKYASWLMTPTVLYAASTREFHIGYDLVSERWNLDLEWQLPLKYKTLEAVNPSNEYTAFLVDDDVFFRDFAPVCPAPGRSFSPRLGDNVTYCYSVDKPQRKGEMDFAYFFSIDCHVYRTKDILPRIRAAEFATPNQFEDVLAQGSPLAIDYGAHSCLVGIPHNKVGEYNNRHAGGSNKALNDRFILGDRLDLDAMDFSSIVGCHQEVPYMWKGDSNVC